MANPAHLEKLCQGPRAWNAWREENPDVIPDLTGVQLTLAQRQLGPSNGGPIDLRGADLEGAVMRYATLTGANFEDARLVGTDLTHARLDDAQLMGANLTDALLDQADLTRAAFDQAVLFGAELSNARNLTSAQLEAAYGDASTRLPGHITPPQSWFPIEDEAEAEAEYAGWDGPATQLPPERDLYETLGIARTAAHEEIRTAYRHLVKKLHPDLNPDDPHAQERFRRVTNAYRILNDIEDRGRYDRGEIDSEGNVNPEFEADRRFRRTAFKYYAAAAASFFLAVGVLAAVWHTVLFRNSGGPDLAQTAEVTAPKRDGRLGGSDEAAASPEPGRSEQKDAGAPSKKTETARLTGPAEQSTQPAASSATPQGRSDSSGSPPYTPGTHAALPDSASTTEPRGSAETGPADAASASSNASMDTLTTAKPDSAPPSPPAAAPMPAEPVMPVGQQQPRDMAQPGPPQQSAAIAPAAVPDPPKTSPEAAVSQQNAAASTAPARSGAPQAQRAGDNPRPLSEAHQDLAGRINASPPEPWPLAALPGDVTSAQPSVTGEPRRARQSRPAPDLPSLAGRSSSQSVVARVLGKRAVKQAFGGKAVPVLVRSEPAILTDRGHASSQDLPTNTIPRKRSPSPRKHLAASGPSATGRRTAVEALPRSLASASGTKAIPQQPGYEARQHQAVSDILAGGM